MTGVQGSARILGGERGWNKLLQEGALSDEPVNFHLCLPLEIIIYLNGVISELVNV